jgi:hypothetical protein
LYSFMGMRLPLKYDRIMPYYIVKN